MKAKSSSSRRSSSGQAGARFAFRRAGGDRPQAGDLGIALQDLEAHAHLVDAVVQRFELGRLVDHVLRRRHLAAVVQPGGDVHRLPILVAELEIGVGTGLLGAGGTRQHLGQFRNAGAVAAGVGALGVDRAGDELDEGLEQHLLGVDQFLALQRNRGGTRQRLDEVQSRRVGLAVAQQQHGADQHLLAVEERDGDGMARVAGGFGQAEDGEVGRDEAAAAGAVRRQRCTEQGAACRLGDGRVAERQGRAVRAQRRRRQQPVAVGQVEDAGSGIGGGQGLAEQARQQAVEVLFAGDRLADVEKAADRLLHRVHGQRQVVDFADWRAQRDRLGEIEVADAVGLAGQVPQVARDAASERQRDRDREQDDDDEGHRQPADEFVRAGHQLAVGNRRDQEQRAPCFRAERAQRGAPCLAVHIEAQAGLRPLVDFREQGGQPVQHRHPEVADADEDRRAARLVGWPDRLRRVFVGRRSRRPGSSAAVACWVSPSCAPARHRGFPAGCRRRRRRCHCCPGWRW